MGSARDINRKVQIISPRGILKPQSDHVSKRRHKTKSRKRGPPVKHPAVTEVTETLVKCKGQVVAKQCNFIKQKYFDLVARLANASRHCEQHIAEQQAIRHALTSPFQDEVLEFRMSSSQNGNGTAGEKHTKKAKLGERVVQFEHRSTRELSHMHELWASWQNCNTEAIAASSELAAAIEAEESLVDSMEDDCQMLRQDLEEKCSGHLVICEKGETEFDKQKSQTRKSLLMLLKAQIS